MGMPILGDYEHGDSKVNRWWREHRGLHRLFLHCFCLNLPPIQHVRSSNHTHEKLARIECLAPLTQDLLEVLKQNDMKQIWHEAITRDPRLLKDFVDERGGTFGRNYRQKE